MDLTAKDAAKLLNVDERTIRQWIADGAIPSYTVGDKTRLNRVELLEWAAEQKRAVAPQMFASNGKKPHEFVLCDAVRLGGVVASLECTDKLSALSAVCRAMPLPEEVDRTELAGVLAAREALCSTAIGNGIAIPHPRSPIVLGVSEPQVTVAFPKKPIEFGALDGKPVHTMFVIVSTTVRNHLLVLSHLMFALKSKPFLGLLAKRASQDDLLAELQRLEEEFAKVDASKGAAR
ncbi:MAG: PTS sugar transporter subunit IIA [Candidatus Hydrogenedentes bacterium]|nr:PTS sugar transporter subunit IIA [Candidatus Hydrogenedentota bacterium]